MLRTFSRTLHAPTVATRSTAAAFARARLSAVVAIAVVTLLFAGCSTTRRNINGDSVPKFNYSEVDRHGVVPTSHDELEDINLYTLLDPEGRSKTTRNPQLRAWDNLAESEKYDLAFRAFYEQYGNDGTRLSLARNRVQDRMFAASERRCGRYKHFLRHDQTAKNFWLGLATTVAGGIGALVPGIRSANNLAGTAGLLSGVRAEYNQAYFANLSVTLIVKGIEQRQEEALETIRRTGQAVGIEKYSLESAVKDAIQFDALCSAVTGLEYASDSVRSQSDPGLDTFNKALVKANLSRYLLSQREIDPGKWADIGYDKSSGLVAMSTRSRGLGSGLVMDTTSDADMNLFDAVAALYLRFTRDSKSAAAKLSATAATKWTAAARKDDLGKLSDKVDQAASGLSKVFHDYVQKHCVEKEVADKARNLSLAGLDLRNVQFTNDAPDIAKARGKREIAAIDAQRVLAKLKMIGSLFDQRIAKLAADTQKAISDADTPAIAQTKLPADNTAVEVALDESGKCSG